MVNIDRPNSGVTAWFGPASVSTATITLTINLFPVTIVPSLVFLLAFLYVAELVAAAILCLSGGRARHTGAGLLVAVIGTLLCFAAATVISQLW
ncbi:Uncharacterised protein [Nocardia otitidiscaviarum]|uniref:Uncharacterized protein n=1 Tax=Nocardia otitidiscaviarum TaxID=1823 RepID=A0A379JGG7_9NOCA|nr:hypothetical protein [Nocardia otitidiscaviarum]SUD47618.1 Uncharacterised protein [Nocardia otitidiscaviarum]